jgi:hypothetical protein
VLVYVVDRKGVQKLPMSPSSLQEARAPVMITPWMRTNHTTVCTVPYDRVKQKSDRISRASLSTNGMAYVTAVDDAVRLLLDTK